MSSEPATILVVDDDALITIGTVDLVNGLGYRALDAYSGAEALVILESPQPIHALITDYGMPDMNGARLAELAQGMRPGLPVILATGYDDVPEAEAMALPRLTKPFRDEEVRDLLATIVAVGA
ncbi:response regulator [Devosia albogilva]|uniref:Response regulator n=1 Tax=Devosia albogilva TaxID=429726 RepID=A0ABW5QJZ5_9HYPH